MKRQNRTRIDLHGLRRLTTLVVLALWLLAACSSDGDDEAATASSTESASETADEPTQADEADGGATDDAEPVAETEPELDEPCNADPTVLTTDGGIDFVRTPDACFAELPGWSYEPSYVEIDGLRQAYVDEGPADGEVILLLHGQPSWSYLYRDMIPVFAEAGYRVIAMDHLGMGRSDKPTEIESYSYLGHGERLETFIAELGLTDINLFVQDWGSLIGLRVAGENTELFSTITVGNGNLPVVPEGAIPLAPVENPEQINDLESPFADIPEQQFPFYDGCELIQPDESI
ncbi:MAG: alpha/beta fold hydrolase, partial [Actinomycetota bacterium]